MIGASRWLDAMACTGARPADLPASSAAPAATSTAALFLTGIHLGIMVPFRPRRPQAPVPLGYSQPGGERIGPTLASGTKRA
jgi:hypothetical protein